MSQKLTLDVLFQIGEKRQGCPTLVHISERPSEVSVDVLPASPLCFDRNIQGFDNPGYENQGVTSERESVISPPRRSSVIREPGSQESGQGVRVSVISPPASKVGQDMNLCDASLFNS